MRRQGEWALCKFINAKDELGKPYPDEWRRYKHLIKITTKVHTDPDGEQRENGEPPGGKIHNIQDGGVTNAQDGGVPAPHGDVPIEKSAPTTDSHLDEPTQLPQGQAQTTHPELDRHGSHLDEDHDDESHDLPTREQRSRKPPDRLAYASAAMTACLAQCALLDFNLQSPRIPSEAFYISIDDGADRLVAEAKGLYEFRDEVFVAADEELVRSEYAGMDPELQRAAMLSADHALAIHEHGDNAPQVQMLRELYAVASFDAATKGLTVPTLDPLYGVASGIRAGDYVTVDEMFEAAQDGCLFHLNTDVRFDEVFALSKSRSAPDIYSERQMRGPEWDTAKQNEIAKIERLGAKQDVCADDPAIAGMPICEMTWAGRDKRNPDGSLLKRNARCCGRGDLDKMLTSLTSNDKTSPVARNSSNLCFDAVACLRAQHKCDYDVPGAYLQREAMPHERRVYRPPQGFRTFDHRGVEVLWWSISPFYGQSDAGAIWNRTANNVLTGDKPPHMVVASRVAPKIQVYIP